MPIDVSRGRHAGLLVPLFSIPSTQSWGIGEILDVPILAGWLHQAGIGLFQMLPINEIAPGQASPYSAITAMAIDPIYVSLRGVPDFAASGGEPAMPAEAREALRAVRASAHVDYGVVRDLKNRALRQAFEHFMGDESPRGLERATALKAYVTDQGWWLDDYALFRTLHARFDEHWWQDWPEALKRHEPEAIEQVRREMAAEIRYHQYVQWLADEQWHAARIESPVALFGDLPFMVDVDSADVWGHQDLFYLDASVGVPPDAFSETGQDWGLPAYRWQVMAERNDMWLRQRARRSDALYDGYRIDHLVGFYRTYMIPRDGGKRRFEPEGEAAQRAQGERVLRVFGAEGARIIAEDLGTVPDFVRASLADLGIPGYKVFRWEREWKKPGKPFRDPAKYPAASVATSGTHDTEPMVLWWENADKDERAKVGALHAVRSRLGDCNFENAPFTAELRDALLEVLFESGSDLLLLPIQDVFGWRERINMPGTVTSDNWTYKLPWPVDRMKDQPDAAERAARLADWSRRYDRGR